MKFNGKLNAVNMEEGIYGVVRIVRTHAHHQINGTRVRGRIQESRDKNGGSGIKRISCSVKSHSNTVYLCNKMFLIPPNPPSFLFIYIFSTESLSVDMAYAYYSDDGPMCQWAWHPTWPYPLAPVHMREISKSEGAHVAATGIRGNCARHPTKPTTIQY